MYGGTFERWLDQFYKQISNRPVLTWDELYERWLSASPLAEVVAEEHRLAREYDRENFES